MRFRMDGGRQSSFTPPLPPTSEDDRLNWLRLLRSRKVGISTFYRLLSEFGSPAAALEALPVLANGAGMSDYAPCPLATAQSELDRARKYGAEMLCIGAEDYPIQLLDLADPPPLLWAIGDVALLNRSCIALVGARNASSLGLRMARQLSLDMGQAGHVIVSGMARGIDGDAHRAALTRGTIAVLGGGVDMLYPKENAELYTEIAARGLILSEQPMGLAPKAQHFPKRNRLIAALARAVIVVEAETRSGTLITARDALDIGREVMAVPGHPLDPRASGPNMLLRDGAPLVRSAKDIIEALPQKSPQQAPAHPISRSTEIEARTTQRLTQEDPSLSPLDAASSESSQFHPTRPIGKPTADLHQQILERIGASPVAEDQVLRDCKISPREGARLFSDLELDGAIVRGPGGTIVRVH